MFTAYSTQATDKGTPHSSPCLKGQGHPAAFWVNIDDFDFMSKQWQLSHTQFVIDLSVNN
ncbi:hypothetical protein [Ktedonobacter racemifer]|uniref:Uncharacterized protein n=1 Tax=Ktedonobacter racemifer DSM 44963 TaxID=485913 RepID=D6U3W7_KTERA|nr:hypothetical protein [Ktedonobacter racemifer]EFH81205.1 hypothetical protein Krac_1906 [Ktedonobacter racemifer DSM 44963]